MTTTLTSIAVALALVPAAAGAAFAQPDTPPPFTLRVTEEATMTAAPDEAEIDVGVTTQAHSSRAAADQNARQASALIVALRKLIGPEATVETISYNLTLEHRYPREGGEPTISGYKATNIVRVTLDNLTRVGEIVDAAVAAGANRIHRIRFTLGDDGAVRAKALKAAAAKARAQAEALASALGVRVVRVLSAVEGPAIVRPLTEPVAMRAEAAAPTPIHPGTLDVHATVTLTVEISEAPATERPIR